MKSSTITLIAILLGAILSIGILWAGYAGLVVIGSKMWEKGWIKGDSIQGPDGYTYCIMYETGIGQDPKTKLIRTKDIEQEESYEDLGSVNAVSSRLTVIRPVDAAYGDETRLYLISNNIVYAVVYHNRTAFIYDIANHQFYAHDNNMMSPFILIEKDDVELYKPDIAWAIWRAVKDYESYRDEQQYITEYFKEAAVTSEYVPKWPMRADLDNGLAHPNKEVQKIAQWFLYIQQNGTNNDSGIGREIKEFLKKYNDM
jgi:hypothetical protein